ncbi:glycine cleavage system protein GcvH [Saccharospirillum salsuginis]|uniref:Glycine cleavage system H protein n=1 Tax=Saccharospirillum salsuginis TaxID=418750 RepID=A0A918NJE0_9GAMM|nr:glycine cleavage system protein GcvH [Saccharospirillum salsuginis]GGX71813.1 glycine cleavage system H protein [Saccharospirillum salsuginis]
MTAIPNELKYAESHEWVRDNGDGTVTIGITDHAQSQLGDIVFVELPSPDQALGKGDDFAVIESVKAASDIYAPIAGTVVATNDALEDAPETVNEDAYGNGWLIKLKVDDVSELDALLTADGYQSHLGNEG